MTIRSKPISKNFSKKAVNEAVTAVHVLPIPRSKVARGGKTRDKWIVTEIGPHPLQKTFSSKANALVFAKRIASKKDSTVQIHGRRVPRLKVGAKEKGFVYKMVFSKP